MVCEVDAQMNPRERYNNLLKIKMSCLTVGEVAQAIWNNAGEDLHEYRRKNVTLPLQEGSILVSPPFKLKSRFKGNHGNYCFF